jgi:hypothetical protein
MDLHDPATITAIGQAGPVRSLADRWLAVRPPLGEDDRAG